MTKENKSVKTHEILKGVEKAYERMVEFKRRNKGEIVVMKGNRIVRIKP
ncbi:hypothetical protein [Limibacterium fermenti]